MGRVDGVERLALELGCNIGSLPTNYLGLPLGTKHRANYVWDEWKKGFAKGWLCGKDNISLKVGDSLSLKAHYLICLPI